ncbi:hypothetical protein niasHT_038192 [Heterodera trifolii]|uniref:Uncharacterized protein n=1 Tax=Heterodera trifolii TaxID=157864 RepID=A0ABD2ISR7_9BILA
MLPSPPNFAVFAPFVVVLLALVGGCAAENALAVEMVPTLIGDYAYRFALQNGDKKHLLGYTQRIKRGAETVEMIRIELGERKDGHMLEIGMVNGQNLNFQILRTNFTKQIWLNEQSAAQQNLRITFDTHFKIDISPSLWPNSKMVYRVDIFCAGGDQRAAAEFKGYTKAEIVVVMNPQKNRANCEQFDVKVWPVHDEWMDKNETLNQPEFVARAIRVANGATHRIRFSNHFHLRISPPLGPNDDKVYIVEIKWQGNERQCQTYRTQTEESAQIVIMGEEKETRGESGQNERQQQQKQKKHYYDIFVWKTSKMWVEKAVQANAKDIMNIIPSQIKTEMKEFAVKIANESTYILNWTSNQSNKNLKRAPNESDENNLATKQQKLYIMDEQMEELQTKIEEMKRQNEMKTEQMSNKINHIGNEIIVQMKQQNEKSLKELQEKITETNRQNEKKINGIRTEIGQIKQKENDKKKLEELLEETTQENDQKMQEIFTQFGRIQTGIDELKHQNENGILRQICTEITLTKQRNERAENKMEQISTQIEQFGAEIAQIKQQKQKGKENEGEMNSLRNEFDGLRTTVLELKQFLENECDEKQK